MVVKVWELTGVTTGDTRSVGCRRWGRRSIVVQAQVSVLKGLEFPTILPQKRWASSLPLLQTWLECAGSMSQLCSVAQSETVIGVAGVPRAWGYLPLQIELAELCGKNHCKPYRAIRQTLHTNPFVPHPIFTPGGAWTLLPSVQPQ